MAQNKSPSGKPPPRSTLSRRDFFERAAGFAGGVAAGLGLTIQSAEAKMPQKASGYQDKPKGAQKCSNCVHFQPPASCALVAGKISPNGWCTFYTKK